MRRCCYGSALILVMTLSMLLLSIAIAASINSVSDIGLTTEEKIKTKLEFACESALNRAKAKLESAFNNDNLAMLEPDVTFVGSESTEDDTLSSPDDKAFNDESYESDYYNYEYSNGEKTPINIKYKIEKIDDWDDPISTYSYTNYRITAYADQQGLGWAGLTQDVEIRRSALYSYYIFFKDDLEINPGKDMKLFGKLHTNANLYLSPNGTTLHVNTDSLTTSGKMYRKRLDTNVQTGTVTISPLSYFATDQQYYDTNEAHYKEMATTKDSRNANFDSLAKETWEGSVADDAPKIEVPKLESFDPDGYYAQMAQENGVFLQTNPVVTVTQTPVYNTINHPAVTHTVNHPAVTHQQCTRYNKNGTCRTWTTIVDTPAWTETIVDSPAWTETVLDHYDTQTETQTVYTLMVNGVETTPPAGLLNEKSFYDGREKQVVKVTEVDVSVLNNLDSNNGMVYMTRTDATPDQNAVAGNSKATDANRVVTGLRLSNASNLSAATTFVSNLPVYIKGDFNSGATWHPAAVIADAITLLSRNWDDTKCASSANCNPSLPSEDATANMVAITGNVETIPNQSDQANNYNGGLENFIRYLENWNNKTVNITGSFMQLFRSHYATGRWNGSYYGVPNRQWGYDMRLRNYDLGGFADCIPSYTQVIYYDSQPVSEEEISSEVTTTGGTSYNK